MDKQCLDSGIEFGAQGSGARNSIGAQTLGIRLCVTRQAVRSWE